MPFHEQAAGVGPVEIVWLHGWGQTHESLAALARGVEGRARNRLIDLPGFGKTPPLAEGAGSAAYAEALHAHLGAGDGGRILVGHSFGARVAVRYAAAYPEAVSALVLIAGAGIPRQRSLGWRLRARALKLLGRAARLLGPKVHEAFRRRFGSADYARAGALRGTLVAVVNENLTETAGRVRCPVLLLYGAEDTETPVEIGESFAAALPDGRLKVLPGFGHLDILSRGAHQCERHIARLIDEVSP